jgi:hypothetical protein
MICPAGDLECGDDETVFAITVRTGGLEDRLIAEVIEHPGFREPPLLDGAYQR